MKTKQTAIEWIEDNLIGNPFAESDFIHNRDVFNQAKAMEKLKLQFQLAKQESYNEGWLEATEYIMKYDKKQEDEKE